LHKGRIRNNHHGCYLSPHISLDRTRTVLYCGQALEAALYLYVKHFLVFAFFTERLSNTFTSLDLCYNALIHYIIMKEK
jgi:hypothetical protein